MRTCYPTSCIRSPYNIIVILLEEWWYVYTIRETLHLDTISERFTGIYNISTKSPMFDMKHNKLDKFYILLCTVWYHLRDQTRDMRNTVFLYIINTHCSHQHACRWISNQLHMWRIIFSSGPIWADGWKAAAPLYIFLP